MRIRSIPFVLISQLLVILLCVIAMKQYYSAANVNDLRWILGPTTALVELITRERFVFESYAGYINQDKSFLIAAPCSGINFLITAFLLLTFGKLIKTRPNRIGWSYMVFAAIAAYFATTVANTVRIATAMQLRNKDPELIWLNPDQLHRFEGIVIYFGCLMLLFFARETLAAGKAARSNSLRDMLRRSSLPLAVYYAITLGVPLVTRIYRGESFTTGWLEHSLFVLLTPLVVLLPVVVFRAIRDHRLFRSESPVLTEKY